MLDRRTNDLASKRRRAGFSLLELSIVLLVVGLITGVALSLKQSGADDCVAVTKIQIKDIQSAMERFVSQNERYPLPALRTAGVEDIKFGREVTLAELAANPSLLDATIPPVTVPPTSSVTYGALPFQALGLAPRYAGDCWGNKFSYAVTTDLTESGKFNQELPLQTYEGVITVQSDSSSAAPVSVKAAYVVVSHGANALGAVKVNYSNGSGDKKYCALSGSLESENCEPSNAVLVGAAYNDGKDAGAQFFDDVIVFSDKKQRSVNGVCNNLVPLGCAPGIASNDNGISGCGTTRTWHCNGVRGGTNDTSCNHTYAACLPCAINTLTWGGGCVGSFPATAHTATSAPATTNTNAAFTGTATATCTNGVFSAASGSCTPVPPPPGACNNSVALGCAAGTPISDNAQSACGTIRTWVCQGNGNSPTCSFTNDACANCLADSEIWGGGCNGDFPATAHGATTPVIDNTNALYTGSATRTCSNGAFSAPSGPCAPVVPEPGACDNTTELACGAGELLAGSDNGLTACGTTRTWTCAGRFGGAPDTTCNKANDACGCAAGWGPEITLDNDSVEVNCGGLSAQQCNAASQSACSVLFQNQINNTGGCASGAGGSQGGNDPSTSGNITECVTRVAGQNANACRLVGRRCGVGGPQCTDDGQPSGGNPASCCNGDTDGNGTCGTQAASNCTLQEGNLVSFDSYCTGHPTMSCGSMGLVAGAPCTQNAQEVGFGFASYGRCVRDSWYCIYPGGNHFEIYNTLTLVCICN